MNTGIIKPKIRKTDWLTAGETGITYKEIVPNGDWTPFLPAPETQYGTYIGTQACTIFSGNNVLETQLKQQGQDVNLSDRFAAKMCGNTRSGSTFQAYWDYIRKNGCVLEADWMFDRSREGKMDWDVFYAEIPETTQNKAKWLVDKYDIRYEWINLGNCKPDLEVLKYHLKQAPLHLAAGNFNNCITEHARCIFKIDDKWIYTFDSNSMNPDGIEKLSLDFSIPWVLKAVITPKVVVPPIQLITPLTKNLFFGQSDKETVQLKRGMIKWGYIKTPINLTTYFGPITAEAVKQFQRDNKVGVLSILKINNGRSVLSGTRIAFNSLLLKNK